MFHELFVRQFFDSCYVAAPTIIVGRSNDAPMVAASYGNRALMVDIGIIDFFGEGRENRGTGQRKSPRRYTQGANGTDP